jgi:hypothetical protein
MSKKWSISLLGLPFLAMHLWAADPPAVTPPATSDGSAAVAAPAATPASGDAGGSAPATPEDLNQLRKRIAQQEEAIKKLQQAVEEQRALLDRALQNGNSAQPGATPVVAGTDALAGAAPVKIVPAVNVARPNIALQKNETEPHSPLGIRIGDTVFTPLGFVDATFFARSNNIGSGLGTNFGSVPFNNASGGHISETDFSTQNTRIGFRVDSHVLGAKVLGYFEADFLGQPPPNVFTTTNGDTFRMRNIFVDVRKGAFEFLGGQDWSLATPNRVGLSPIPSDIFYTQNMDVNYQAGLIWARQSQFRFVAHPSDNFAIGLSIENAQQYGGGSGGGSVITAPPAFASLLTNNAQIFTNISVTTTPSLYGGTNTPNVAPDFIAKAAYDAHLGDKILHFELAGLESNFKVVEGAGTSASPFHSQTGTGFSGEFNTNLQLTKSFRLIENLFYGQGNGRYIFGLVPDFIITASGGISPIHSGSTVDGFELNLGKNTLLSMLYGGVYAAQDFTVIPTTTKGKTTYSFYGYGYPGSSQNKSIQEGTIDLVQTLWSNPNYGKLALIMQYSYLNRNPWFFSAATGAPKEAHTNMAWVDVRYTLP